MAVTLLWIRDHYDAISTGGNGNRYIDEDEMNQSLKDYFANKITSEQNNAVIAAYNAHSQLPPYDAGTETKTTSLSEGNHDVKITLLGYEDFKARINVGTSSVTCVAVSGWAACGGSGLPRLETGGWTVTARMKESTGVSSYAEWLTSKGGLPNVTLPDIFELKDAFIGLEVIGFAPTLPQIMECKDAFIGL